MFPVPLVTVEANARRPPDYPRQRSRVPPGTGRGSTTAVAGSWPLMAEDGSMAGRAAAAGRRLRTTSARMASGFSTRRSMSAATARCLGRYDKNHLVMFGEYTPFVEYFPWLQHLTPLTGNAVRGRQIGGLRRWAAFAIAPSICYENVLPHVIRRQVNALAAEGKEPDILDQPDQRRLVLGLQRVGHAPGLRGVSRGGVPQAAADCRQHGLLGVDRRRRPHPAKGPRRATAVIVAEPRLDNRRSWYLAHGDWFAGALPDVLRAAGGGRIVFGREASPCESLTTVVEQGNSFRSPLTAAFPPARRFPTALFRRFPASAGRAFQGFPRQPLRQVLAGRRVRPVRPDLQSLVVSTFRAARTGTVSPAMVTLLTVSRWLTSMRQVRWIVRSANTTGTKSRLVP